MNQSVKKIWTGYYLEHLLVRPVGGGARQGLSLEDPARDWDGRRRHLARLFHEWSHQPYQQAPSKVMIGGLGGGPGFKRC